MSDKKLKIDGFEKIFNNKNNPVWRVLNEYRRSQEADNDYIDFHEVIWIDEVKNICKFLQDNGVETITTSSTQSNLIEILYLFTLNGYRVRGLKMVHNVCLTALIPAIVLKLDNSQEVK